MGLPGFHASASLYESTNVYRTAARHASNDVGRALSPQFGWGQTGQISGGPLPGAPPIGSTNPLRPPRTCLPGSTTAGCPLGSYCTEPGSWPYCRCLQCFGGKIGQSGWNLDDGGWD
jgi:hypothetical protein